MSLITEFGRYDRCAVQARARAIRAKIGPMEWGDALTMAYREASDELRERFGRSTCVTTRADRMERAHV